MLTWAAPALADLMCPDRLDAALIAGQWRRSRWRWPGRL
jgi:hypothetical protein